MNHPKFKANAALLRLDHEIKKEEYSSSNRRKDYEEVTAYIEKLESALSGARVFIKKLTGDSPMLDPINEILPEEPETRKELSETLIHESCKKILLDLRVGDDMVVRDRSELNFYLFLAAELRKDGYRIEITESTPNRPHSLMIRRIK